MNRDELSQSMAGEVEKPVQCERCGATAQVGQGFCVNCLLREGLAAEGEASTEVFESVLAEANVPDKQWRLGNYEILEEIGRGGMGVIYRARQRHSRRIVAVKRVLSHQADSHETLVRFRREAEAAAKLDHPNILPIHEVSESEDGLPFFSMKYATGGSLRAAGPALRSQPNECVRLIAKVARAIEYAHGQGILHRDLQPGNILLDSRGEPMVSDFGLAKWLSEESDLTKTLTTFGTPGYIAPEQAEGAAGDLTPTADVYSLGAILFNLLANRPPFVGANVLSVIRQAAATPAPKLRLLVPSLDRDLETICARCLERDPKARYQTAGDFAADLERWLDGRSILARPVRVPARLWRWSRRNPVLAATAVISLSLGTTVLWLLSQRSAAPPTLLPSEKSIAVLPFENLSDDKSNAYFVDGIQDDLLTSLAKIKDLKVISRTSVMSFRKSGARNLRAIGKELGAANVLEGSVRRVGNRVLVNVQLVDTMTDQHIWAERYDRTLADSVTLQGELASEIAAALRATLSPDEKARVEAKYTDNPDAYVFYLRGREVQFRPETSRENFLSAVDFFKQAIALDPKFVLARARLSYVQASLYRTFERTNQARLAEARFNAEEALRLDPKCAEAHQALAQCALLANDEVTALRESATSVQLNPNDASIAMAAALAQQQLGLEEEAITSYKRAVELAPREARVYYSYGILLDSTGHPDEARAALDRALVLAPQSVIFRLLRANGESSWSGDVSRIKAILSGLPPGQDPDGRVTSAYITVALIERNFPEALKLLNAYSGETLPTAGNFGFGDQTPKAYNEGMIRLYAGDRAGAYECFDSARWTFEVAVKDKPQSPNEHLDLALVYAQMGWKEAALAEAARVSELEEAQNIPPKLRLYFFLAQVYGWAGEPDLAFGQLEQFLALPPAGITAHNFRNGPVWDPLRNDPRFQKFLVAKKP